jgi:hypothetical protein
MVAALLAGLAWTPHLSHETSCLFVQVLPTKAPGPAKLLACSNIEQTLTIPSDGTVRDAEADVPGWRMFTGNDGFGRIRISIKNVPGSYVFYPRLSQEEDRIFVYQVFGQWRRLLYFEHGTNNGWSPVARCMLLRADCIDSGWSYKESPFELEIVLEGPHVQLWHKGDIIFF